MAVLIGRKGPIANSFPWILASLAAGWLAACGGGGGSGNSAPTASFTVTPPGGDAPLEVEVDASASFDPDGAIVSYAWDFGDGATGTGVTALHVYNSENTYPLRLTVTDDAGKQRSTQVDVEVTQPPIHYAGLYGSSIIDVEDVVLVLDVENGIVTGTLRDGAGRSGTVSGTSTTDALSFQVTWTTPGCPGSLDVQGDYTSQGIDFTFDGADCEGIHVGGLGEVLREDGEVLAFGQPHPAGLQVQGGDLFWSSDAETPLQRLELASGAITGLAPRVGALKGLTPEGGMVLWTEAIETGAGSCGSATSVMALRRSSDGAQIETLDVALSCSLEVSSDLVVSNGSVFWALQTGTSPDQFAIRRTPLDGSPPDNTVSSDRHIRALAADGQHLYWSEEGIGPDPSVVRRVPLAGGPVEDVFTTSERPVSIALAANAVLIAERLWASNQGNLWGASKAGGAASLLASFTSAPHRIALSGTTVAWATDAEVGTLALPGGPALPLAPTLAPALDLVFDGAQLTWIESDPLCCGGRLRSVPLVGGMVQELAELVSPLRLARAPDATLLWIEGGDDPAADAALRTRTPAGDVDTFVGGLQRSPAIAVDDSDLYCVQGWWIKRVSRAGGTPERFAQAGFYIVDVALDDDYVYWLVGDPFGTVQRSPKAGGPIEGVSSGNGMPLALAVAAGQALWAEGPDKVRSAPVIGGPSSVFIPGLEFPTDIVTDGEYVYVNAQDAGLLRRKSLLGGAVELVGGFGIFSLSTLAVDGDYLLAIDQTAVGRVPKTGGDFQDVAAVWNDVFEAGSVAGANGYIYWTETLLGTILRRYVGF